MPFPRLSLTSSLPSPSTLSYRRKPPSTGPSAPRGKLPKLPPHGGTLTISLVSTPAPRRSPRSRVLAEIQEKTKLGARQGRKTSDEVEGMMWEVAWKPEVTALGVDRIPREEAVLGEKEVVVVCDTTPNL